MEEAPERELVARELNPDDADRVCPNPPGTVFTKESLRQPAEDLHDDAHAGLREALLPIFQHHLATT